MNQWIQSENLKKHNKILASENFAIAWKKFIYLSLAKACKTLGAPTREAIALDKVAAKHPAKIKYPVNEILAIICKKNLCIKVHVFTV